LAPTPAVNLLSSAPTRLRVPVLAAREHLRLDSAVSRYAAAVVAFALLTVAWTWPHPADLSGTVLGQGGDPLLGIRYLWALDQQGASPFTGVNDEYLGAPEGVPNSRAINVANAAFTGTLWLLGQLIGFVAAFNVYNLFCLFSAGVAGFVLLDRLRFGLGAATFGSYVLAFNPNHFEKALGHAPLAATWIFPVLLLGLVAFRRSRSARAAVVSGLLLALAFYLNSYLGLFALMLVFIWAIVDLWLRPAGTTLYAALRGYYFLAASWLVLMIPTALVWWADRRTTHAFEASRVELAGGGASAHIYLLPSPRHPILGGPMRDWLQTNLSWESTMFFGYTTLTLAVAGVVVAIGRWRRSTLGREEGVLVLFAVLLVIVAGAFSLPQKQAVGPIELPTPGYALAQITSLYRVYSRFGILVGLGLVLLAAYALSRLLRNRRAAPALVAALLAVAAFELSVGTATVETLDELEAPATAQELAEFQGVPLPLTKLAPTPAYVDWLADRPGGIVADYPNDAQPYGEWAWKDQFLQMRHGHPLFQAAAEGTREAAIRSSTADLDHSQTAGILAAENVRYVVLHLDRYEELGIPVPSFLGCAFVQLTSSKETGAAIYEVKAPPLRRYAIASAGFYDPEPFAFAPADVYWQWMRSAGRVYVRSASPGAVFLTGGAASLKGTRRLDVRDEEGSIVTSWEILPKATFFRMVLTVKRGWNEFTFDVSGPELMRAEGDPRLVTIAVSPLVVTPLNPEEQREEAEEQPC
jgi:hypothetical protein